MDGFTYTNIFETKGIEYLIIIAFLGLIVPFWLVINRKSSVASRIRNSVGVLTAAILRIPEGIYFNRNHTWTFLEKDGNAKVGLDDFLLHVTGDVKINPIYRAGDVLKKGDLIIMAERGDKVLRIYAPVSGTVTGVNPLVTSDPSELIDDPYTKGWIYRIKPSAWKAETSSLFIAEEAITWMRKELDIFRDFLARSIGKHAPDSSLVALQDGGELIDRPLADLPDVVWQDFQQAFLN